LFRHDLKSLLILLKRLSFKQRGHMSHFLAHRVFNIPLHMKQCLVEFLSWQSWLNALFDQLFVARMG
jgi:hypothetical protein